MPPSSPSSMPSPPIRWDHITCYTSVEGHFKDDCDNELWRLVQMEHFFFFLNFIYFLIYLFLAVLGPRCCVWALSSRGKRGPPLAAVRGPPIAVASHPAEHRLQACGLQQLQHAGPVIVARELQSTGSAVVAHGPSRPAACGILPDQGPNPRPPHRQADSQPLHHQGSPKWSIFTRVERGLCPSCSNS